VYTLTVTDDIDLTDFVPVSLIGTKPLAKYQSALVEYSPDLEFEPSSSLNKTLFILGGANEDSLSLDLVERLDTSTAPYEYTNSEISLTSLLKGRNALGAAFAYGIDDEYGAISPYIYVLGGKTSGTEDGIIKIGYDESIIDKTIRGKLDGKQSITFPITLKKNGRFLADPVDIIIRGFVKFEDEANPNVEVYESDSYQKESANKLEDKTIVYPVLFTSDRITINNGKGTITLLPRSEDILSDFDTITGRAGIPTVETEATVSEEEILASPDDAQIIIEAGEERTPYKVSIEVTIIDNNGQFFGQTVDRGTADLEATGGGLFEQSKQQVTSNLIVEYHTDIEWIPSIESLLDDNAGTPEEALKALDNLSNQVAFGSSAMYDAISKSAETLSNNDIDDLRKVIYILTDNDSNMSITTSDAAIEKVNAIDGFKKVPILTGNLQITEPITLSVKANTTDTINLNKLGFLTGGQSVTVVSEDFIDEIVDIFYGEAVGALGYGYYEFVIDLQEVVAIESIIGDFSVTDVRSSASWQIEISDDGFIFTPIDDIFSVTSTYQEEDISARFIKFKVTLLTGFSGDEYSGEPVSPTLNNFKIIYNESKTVFLFLKNQDDGLPPYQMVIGVDGNADSPENIEVGLSKSNSTNWIDFSNGSQPTIDQNGKIVIPLRFSQDTDEFPQEPLDKVDDFTLKTSYGIWDPYSSVTLYDKNEDVILSSEYKLYPREGFVIFNGILPYDYTNGDYTIGILNGNDYKIGLKLTNVSNEKSLEFYGIGKMYTTGKDLLPPVDKIAPEAQEVAIEPQAPNLYSPISLEYIYFDSNFESEDLSQREIKWYINGVRIGYLDGLTSWNDLSDVNDPLYQNVLSFTISSLNQGETAEQRARSLGQSILKVGDTIYGTIKVSDGDLFSQQEKSDTIIVVEGAPSISNLKIQALDNDGAIVDRISSNNIAFVNFTLDGDTVGNKSEIIWFVDGFEFKRGIYGDAVGNDEIPHDRLHPGEVSLNTGDWALKLSNEIHVQIIPSTGSAVGDVVNSSTVIVENALPEVTNAVITPTTITQFSTIILTWDFADFDIDVLQDGTQVEETTIQWYLKVPPVDANQSTIFREVTDPDLLEFITVDVTNHVSTVDASILSPNQQWYAKLTPNDSIDDGKEVLTAVKIITNG